MTLPRSVREVLSRHVTFELESIDRLYLNVYMPSLQRPEGAAHFWIHHRGHRFASSGLMGPMSESFVAANERFAKAAGIDLIVFAKGQRKEEVARAYREKFQGEEGCSSSARRRRRRRWCARRGVATPRRARPIPGW